MRVDAAKLSEEMAYRFHVQENTAREMLEDEADPLPLPLPVQELGARFGFHGIIHGIAQAFGMGKLLTTTRLDARLEDFEGLLHHLEARPLLVTLIDSVNDVPLYASPGDDEGKVKGGPWLSAEHAFYIKWRAAAAVTARFPLAG